jgi:hypothetical protein
VEDEILACQIKRAKSFCQRKKMKKIPNFSMPQKL